MATWFVGDDEGRKRFGGFYGVHPRWWDLVRTDDARHGWVARIDDQPVGFVDLDVGPDGAHVAFYLRADRRNQRLGVPLLTAAVAEARLLGVTHLVASVEEDNQASLACCRQASFRDAGSNEFGERVLIRELS